GLSGDGKLRGGAQHVVLGDAAARAGAPNGGDIDAVLLGQAPCQRGREHAFGGGGLIGEDVGFDDAAVRSGAPQLRQVETGVGDGAAVAPLAGSVGRGGGGTAAAGGRAAPTTSARPGVGWRRVASADSDGAELGVRAERPAIESDARSITTIVLPPVSAGAR